MAYTEANYENAIIELLRDHLGYDYLYGPDNNFSDLDTNEREEHKTSYKDEFLNSSGIELTDSEKESLKSRIYVSYNSNMFSLLSNKESDEHIV